MAGIITISPGHDASYPWRQIGTSAGPAQAGQTGAGYYLSPAEKGGEPPGRWHGGGLAALNAWWDARERPSGGLHGAAT